MGHREELIQRSIPFLQEVKDMTPSARMEKWLNEKYSENSDLYKDLARLIKLGVEEGWAANQEVDGPNYRRSRIAEPSPEIFHFSITAVYMNSKDPKRFKDSKAVPAHLGLTPRVYQSGEIDRSGNISNCGDKMMRHALYEAANSHLRISKKWSVLRAWGVKLAKRIGAKKACVAVARKLAIIMHRMWVDGADFRFGEPPTALAA